MDCRLTLGREDSFMKMLEDLFRSGEMVYLLYDKNGMTRAEGFIKTIHADSPTPFVEMENGLIIILKDIVALNGIFLPEYGEC